MKALNYYVNRYKRLMTLAYAAVLVVFQAHFMMADETTGGFLTQIGNSVNSIAFDILSLIFMVSGAIFAVVVAGMLLNALTGSTRQIEEAKQGLKLKALILLGVFLSPAIAKWIIDMLGSLSSVSMDDLQTTGILEKASASS